MSEPLYVLIYRSVAYVIELLLAVNIILFRWPKKKRFPWCFPLCCVILIGASASFFFYRGPFNNWLSGFVFLLQMSAIFVAMFLCYDVPKKAILSACIGGIAIQHIGFQVARLLYMIPGAEIIPEPFFETMICLPLFYFAYLTFARTIAINEYWKAFDPRMIGIAIVTIFITIVLMRFNRQSEFDQVDIYIWVKIANACYAIVSASLALFVLFYMWRIVNVRSRLLVQSRVEEEQRKQYEQQLATAELINIKFHDLKHKINSLKGQIPEQEIESIGAMLREYDANYNTGSAALDALLNQKAQICLASNISLTFMGDGSALNFLDDWDIVSLFGNILDNAIEASVKILDLSRRVISITLEKKGEMVCVSTMNYTDVIPTIVDGLPESTKSGEKGFHGFGMKSIRNIAEKYNGGVNFSIDQGVFSLSLYMFPPESK